MNSALRTKVVALMIDTGHAHHKAFEDVNGDDPEWPIWYAGYLRDALSNAMNVEFTQSQLIYCLMNANFELTARAPDANWAEFYADEILERYAGSETATKDQLALYQSVGCPFCVMVRSAISKIGVDVEMRDIFANAQHRDDLVATRGRATVPVLRITSPNGEERWMPESRDIIRYLQEHYS
jgi:glutaredoxin